MVQENSSPPQFSTIVNLKTIEVFIEKIVFGGDGLGSVDGKACFVEGALPGETVIARLSQDKKNFLKARAVQILKRSPHRIEAPCRYAGRCGGCQYQHVAYPEELRLKETQIREIFERSLHIPASNIEAIIYSDKDFGYRNSVTLHRTVEDEKTPQHLGFIGSDNHSKVAVNNCLIADPRFEPLFLKKVLLKKNVDKLSFKLSEKGEIYSDQQDLFLRVFLSGQSLLVHSKGFFQNNLSVTELLVKRISTWIQQSGCRIFFDLYAGVGTFSFLSGQSAKKVTCIEESPYSIHALRMNKEERKCGTMEVIAGRVEKAFPPVFEKEKDAKSIVLLDPPRQGIEPSLAAYLSSEGVPENLIYLSCDPLTLVRDLKIILSKGCYELETVTPFDMFPKTKHIETAVLLKKKSASVVQK